MKSLVVTAPDTARLVDVERPGCGMNDVLVAVKACGICGTDVHYRHVGGARLGRQGSQLPLGHEPAGEVGAQVTGVRVGDHVVINPMATDDGIMGNGGAQGAMSEFVVLRDAREGVHYRVIPDSIPWEVAALNEPMAVAYHGVNRSGAGAGSKVVVFGAGPIGLGAIIGFKAKGVEHIIAVDPLPGRLKTALAVGADAVINPVDEDQAARLRELHGAVPFIMGGNRAGTDVYFDAAGAAPVIAGALSSAKTGAVLTVVAAHKTPVQIDLAAILATEIDLRMSMGYPTEIFEVTDLIVRDVDKYRLIVSNTFSFSDAERAIELAATPGAADKVVVLFD